MYPCHVVPSLKLKRSILTKCYSKEGYSSSRPRKCSRSFGEEHLTNYSFAYKNLVHRFCNVCGVPIHIVRVNNISPVAAVNLRAMNNVEWEKLDITKVYREKFDPPYKVGL